MMKSTNNKLSSLIFIDDVRTHDVHQTPHKAFDLAAIKLRIFTFALKLIAII